MAKALISFTAEQLASMSTEDMLAAIQAQKAQAADVIAKAAEDAAKKAAEAASRAAQTEEAREALQAQVREAYQAKLPRLGDKTVAALKGAGAKVVTVTYLVSSDTFDGQPEPLMVAYAGVRVTRAKSDGTPSTHPAAGTGEGAGLNAKAQALMVAGETRTQMYKRLVSPEAFNEDIELIEAGIVARIERTKANGGDAPNEGKVRGSVEYAVHTQRINKIAGK